MFKADGQFLAGILLAFMCTTMGQAPPGGKPTGGGGGTQACTNPTCSSPPCIASRLGDVGCTTVDGVETISHEMKAKGATISSNAHIYGAFEAGFSEQQKSIIEGWGCTDASVVYDTQGGLDISIAEKKVAHACNVELPRVVGNNYIGIVGLCGGHTKDYHFHRSLECLYTQTGGHSPAVGNVAQYKLFGKREDFANSKLPLLDARGAHFGPTPDSNGASVYHYHVQDSAPFTVGCVGPTADNKLVSVAACRALDSTNCDGVFVDVHIGPNTIVKYDRFCPCFDANGSNSGINIVELPALSTTKISCTVSGTCANNTNNPSSSTPIQDGQKSQSGSQSGIISASATWTPLGTLLLMMSRAITTF